MQTNLLMAEPERRVAFYTIGFTQKSAEQFFALISTAKISKVIDTRIFPNTQLSGFAKQRDLPYFLKELSSCAYEHRTDLAPSEDLLRRYRDRVIDWSQYEIEYLDLLKSRRVEESLSLAAFELDRIAFLCAEASDKFCHRRLLAGYLNRIWPILVSHDLGLGR